MKNGKVYIIGSGPGNYKLLTLRAIECIKNSDVIVYDRLIDSKVLSFASNKAEFVYVGKQPDFHQVPQKEISNILARYAMEGKTVARVKGGDPFLFGRGGEECEVLQNHGIEFEIVPGVTSAISVPAYAGIPVTHRDYASSLHIITGHKSQENEAEGFDYETYAKLEGTLVFLMGVKNLKEICSGLIKFGKKADTPAAIVENGASPGQRVIIGTLADISEKSAAAGIKSPAVIVIGDVAKLGEKLSWYNKGPLSGKKIIVTRPADQSEKLVKGLEELGAQVIEYPSIVVKELEDYSELKNALEIINQFKWLVFTSANAVNIFFKQLRNFKLDIRILTGLKIAVVGKATAELLEDKGIYVDFMPEKFTSSDLLKGLIKIISKDDKVLIFKSEIGRQELSEGLKNAGISLDEINLYNIEENDKDKTVLLNILEKDSVDYITFTSPSTVRAFVSIAGMDTIKGLSAKFVCVGPVTENALTELGLKAAGVAAVHNDSGLIDKIVELSEV